MEFVSIAIAAKGLKTTGNHLGQNKSVFNSSNFLSGTFIEKEKQKEKSFNNFKHILRTFFSEAPNKVNEETVKI